MSEAHMLSRFPGGIAKRISFPDSESMLGALEPTIS